MPELKYKGHTYSKTSKTYATYEGDSPAAKTYGENVTENIRAVFEVIGASQYDRGRGRTPKPTQPESIVVRFVANNGGPWEIGHGPKLLAYNVKKGGVRGADVDLETWDWSGEVKELVGKGYGEDGGQAIAWVKAEYPREGR